MAFNKNPHEFPGDSTPVSGGSGGRFSQDDDGKQVLVSGATKNNRDFDIDSHDLVGDGNYETGVLKVSGTAVVGIAADSADDAQWHVEIDVYNDAEDTVLKTFDHTDNAQAKTILNNNHNMTEAFRVFGDKIKIKLVDDSGGGQNVISGSIYIHSGNESVVKVGDQDGEILRVSDLDNSLSADSNGLLTYLARALASQDIDELLTREHNSGLTAHGKETVASSGTEEALNGGASQAIEDGQTLWVKALNGNTNLVYVGDGDVGSADGFELAAGEALPVPETDVSNVSIDVDTDGEGVCWIVV